MKQPIVFAFKVLLVFAILGYLFYDVTQAGQWQELLESPKRWGWVGVAWLACLSAHVLGFLRWQIMVRALNLPFSVIDSIRIGLIGLFFGLFAFGVVGGDTLRAYYVTRKLKNRTPEAVTSVLADRLIGILTMFMIATVAFLFFDLRQLGDQSSHEVDALRLVGWFVVACTTIGILGLVVLFFTPRMEGTALYHRLVALPKIGLLVVKVMAVVKLYRSRLGTIAAAFAYSVGVNLCFVVSIYTLAMGLTDGNPTFANHFVIEPIAMVFNAIPMPGGIGTMEFAMKYLYLAFGSDNGVIIAFAYRFALLSVSAIGAIVWFGNRSQVADLEQGLQDTTTDIEKPL